MILDKKVYCTISAIGLLIRVNKSEQNNNQNNDQYNGQTSHDNSCNGAVSNKGVIGAHAQCTATIDYCQCAKQNWANDKRQKPTKQ